MYRTSIPGSQQGPTSETLEGRQVRAQPRVSDDFAQPAVSSKWWTAAMWAAREKDFCQCMYPHPLALQPTPAGLGLCYPTRLQMSEDQRMYSYPYEEDLLVGLAGLDGADLRVAAYSD